MPFFRSAVLGAIISHRQHSADGFTLVVWGGLFKPRSWMILSLEMARPTSVITAHKWWPRICSTIPCNNGSAEIQINSKHGVLPVKKNNDGSKCWAEIIKKKINISSMHAWPVHLFLPVHDRRPYDLSGVGIIRYPTLRKKILRLCEWSLEQALKD